MTLDHSYFDRMEEKIPHGKVRTRFAPSPTGYMHIGNLRTALLPALRVELSFCALRTPTRAVRWRALWR